MKVKKSRFQNLIVLLFHQINFQYISLRSGEWGAKYYKDIYCFKLDDYPINDLSLLKK